MRNLSFHDREVDAQQRAATMTTACRHYRGLRAEDWRAMYEIEWPRPSAAYLPRILADTMRSFLTRFISTLIYRIEVQAGR